MKWAVVWTLKRGMLNPPEPVDAETERQIERSILLESDKQRRPQWMIDAEYWGHRLGG